MSSNPLARRHASLDDKLRQLDEDFVPTLTPTNTWLSSVQQSNDDEYQEDHYDLLAPSEVEPVASSSRNQYEKPPKPSNTWPGRSSSANSSLKSEPRSLSLPLANQPTPVLPTRTEPPPNDTIEEIQVLRPSPESMLDADASIRRAATEIWSQSAWPRTVTLPDLERRGTAPLEDLLRANTGLDDNFTSPSRVYSTQDGLFSTSPWIPASPGIRDENSEFIRISDLHLALTDRLQEVGSSSGSQRSGISRQHLSRVASSSGSERHSDKPKSSPSVTTNTGIGRGDGDEDDPVELQEGTTGMDDDGSFYVEGVDIELAMRSPSFQMRVFDPDRTESDSSINTDGDAVCDDGVDTDVITTAEDAADTDVHNEAYAEGTGIDDSVESPSFQMRVFDPECTTYESGDRTRTEDPVANAWSGFLAKISGEGEEPSATNEDDSPDRETIDSTPTPADTKRRSSDNFRQGQASPGDYGMRRVSTMTEYERRKGRHKSPKLVAFKASPAGPAMTMIAVQPADSWKVSTVYAEPPTTAYEPGSSSPRRTSQTIQSATGISQILWEEPSSNSDSEITVLTGSEVDYLVEEAKDEGDNVDSPSPTMERVKTKLRAWSWERELSEATSARRNEFIPLLESEQGRHERQPSDQELPPGPPNTADASSESSALPSEPQTPEEEAENDEEEEEDSAMELKFKSLRSAQPTANLRPPSPDTLAVRPRRTNSLPTSSSNLGELRFPAHRDSVDMTHDRLKRHETEGKQSQELIMNARDSFLITKSRFEAKHPRAAGGAGGSGTPGPTTWNRFGGLDPIPDASPPAMMTLAEKLEKKKKAGKKVEVLVEEPAEEEDRSHPDEHENCPICEEHRPRWFEATHREW